MADKSSKSNQKTLFAPHIQDRLDHLFFISGFIIVGWSFIIWYIIYWEYLPDWLPLPGLPGLYMKYRKTLTYEPSTTLEYDHAPFVFELYGHYLGIHGQTLKYCPATIEPCFEKMGHLTPGVLIPDGYGFSHQRYESFYWTILRNNPVREIVSNSSFI